MSALDDIKIPTIEEILGSGYTAKNPAEKDAIDSPPETQSESTASETVPADILQEKDTDRPDKKNTDTITVGEPVYGYLDIPSDWVKAEPDPDIKGDYIEYDDPTGKHEIVLTYTENYYSQKLADDVYDMWEASDEYKIIYSCKTTFDGCTAYRIDADKVNEGRTIVVWIFEDDNLITHMMNIESPDPDSILPITATYRINK